jgi:hypothetical protein
MSLFISTGSKGLGSRKIADSEKDMAQSYKMTRKKNYANKHKKAFKREQTKKSLNGIS